LDNGERFVEFDGEAIGSCCALTFGTFRPCMRGKLEPIAKIAKPINVIMIDLFANLFIDEQHLSLDLFISTFYSMGKYS
jgi:hypothetical protein